MGGLLFGSELKALLCHPGLSREVDLQALDTYLALNYTLAPRTMLREVQQVRPGHRLVYEGGRVRESAYWTLRKGDPTARRPAGDAVEAFLETFGEAVRKRLLADVPLGAFLSGGIDSSAVVATMQRAMGAPARTFCLAFKEESWGEQDYARKVARYVGAAHQESEVPGEPLADALPRIVAALDEPHGDTSAVPMYYLCQATRRGVTVALSGDGGDEVFGGYETYVADALRPLYGRLPARVRTGIVGPLARALPASGRKLATDEMARRFVAGADLGGDEAHYTWRAIFGREERLGLLDGAAREVAAGHEPLEDYLALCPHRGRLLGRAALHVPGRLHLAPQRHPGQGRPHQHGPLPGGAGPVPGPPAGGAGLLPAP